MVIFYFLYSKYILPISLWTKTMGVWYYSRFQTCEVCSFESYRSRACLTEAKPCSHSSTIVMSSRMHDCVDLKLVTLIYSGNNSASLLRWKLDVLIVPTQMTSRMEIDQVWRQERWYVRPPLTCDALGLSRVRGGVDNHGSCQTLATSYNQTCLHMCVTLWMWGCRHTLTQSSSGKVLSHSSIVLSSSS